MDNETKVYQADFEIMSVMRGLQPLAAMIASNDQSSRKTITNVIKTAAILMQVSQSQEPYRQYTVPQQTAYAPR